MVWIEINFVLDRIVLIVCTGELLLAAATVVYEMYAFFTKVTNFVDIWIFRSFMDGFVNFLVFKIGYLEFAFHATRCFCLLWGLLTLTIYPNLKTVNKVFRVIVLINLDCAHFCEIVSLVLWIVAYIFELCIIITTTSCNSVILLIHFDFLVYHLI